MSAPAQYTLPTGIVGLRGPVEKPAPGTLPLRGDLAHIALADHFLSAHYVIPHLRAIGASDVVLKLNMRKDAADGATLAVGTPVELLDQAGDWVWVTKGPEGPSGYLDVSQLAPDVDA